MRILIDLQAGQSDGSRNRGIGRYSLALVKAMVRQKGEHEIIITLSDSFPEAIEVIRGEFKGLLPQDKIRVWNGLKEVASLTDANNWRRHSMQKMREAFFASLHPDITLVCSLFEGLTDDAVTSIETFPKSQCTAVILYDLIPFIYQNTYLEFTGTRNWYFEKIEFLKKANLLLAISESSRQEAIAYLNFAPDQVVNILGDADVQFVQNNINEGLEARIREQYRLRRPFIMYTGGIDHRKNIHRLIAAFAQISKETREQYQLAIVCSAKAKTITDLKRYVVGQGLDQDDVVFTGYVPDEDLVCLYNLCVLFVFPSWHEGFGLPALEAMRCGAPVIASNNSSLPEVIGLKEALFDPDSEQEIASLMERGLIDGDFRALLLEHARQQANRFSWDLSAQKTILAMEKSVESYAHALKARSDSGPRLRLAFVSPLPPARSGIADYSADLIACLSEHYDIELIVDQKQVSDSINSLELPSRNVQWLLDHQQEYDRVLYHFGNSTFHQHMFELLKQVPGVVVLHDFYLSGILAHVELHGVAPQAWAKALYSSHGYHAVAERYHERDSNDVLWRYPANGQIIEHSLGMIVHSEHSIGLARQWYDLDHSGWAVVPLLRNSHSSTDDEKACVRHRLGFADNDLVVCSFGLLGPTKLNHRLLQAWLKSSLSKNKHCRLIFVGENSASEYGMQLSQAIDRAKAQSPISITGWVNAHQFAQYLTATDLGVQLRTLSRGETSAAVLDCMSYGLATIVNAHGSMADLDPKIVCMLEDHFSDEDLVQALETLWGDAELRQKLGQQAREFVSKSHHPKVCANQYYQAIEKFYEDQSFGVDAYLLSLDGNVAPGPQNQDLVNLAHVIDINMPPKVLGKTLFVDVSAFVGDISLLEGDRQAMGFMKSLLKHQPTSYRVEPIYFADGSGYRYARSFTLSLLKCPPLALDDEPIRYQPGDIYLDVYQSASINPRKTAFYEQLVRAGVSVILLKLCQDMLDLEAPMGKETINDLQDWSTLMDKVDGFLCTSKEEGLILSRLFSENVKSASTPCLIDWIDSKSWAIDEGDLGVGGVRSKSDLANDFEHFIQRLSSAPA
jgi:glycosyltransferase involved in cell wall biosynthesis